MPLTPSLGRPARSELLRAVLRNARAEGLDIAALPVPTFLGHLGRWVRAGSVPLPSENMVDDMGAAFAAPTSIDALRVLDRAARRRAAARLRPIADRPPRDEEPLEEVPPFEEELPPFVDEIVDLRDKPLIFVPGILGSGLGIKIFDDDSVEIAADPFYPPSLVDGGEVEDKIEELLANLVIPPASVAPVGLFPGAYDKLISAIRLMGYRENVNFFVHAYDWRRSNRESGASLAQLMEDLLDDHPEWEATGFDVIAHSMGCLVTAEAHRIQQVKQGFSARIDRKVLIAGPHYGAFLAFAVLNPRVRVIDGFKAFVLELAWDARFKAPGASENFQDGLKRIARGFPSVYELLPDDFSFDDLGGRVVEYFGRGGNRRPDRCSTALNTYTNRRAGFRKAFDNLVKNALRFKRPLQTLRGDPARTLVIYSDSVGPTPDTPRGTPDIVMFQRDRVPEFAPIRDSGQNGDGTVPTKSARDLRGAINVRKIEGNHNQIANDDATIALIRRHLGVD
jgi:hypothetical protein